MTRQSGQVQVLSVKQRREIFGGKMQLNNVKCTKCHSNDFEIACSNCETLINKELRAMADKLASALVCKCEHCGMDEWANGLCDNCSLVKEYCKKFGDNSATE